MLTAQMLEAWAESRALDYVVIIHLNGILAGLGVQGLLKLFGWSKASLGVGVIIGLAMMIVPGTVAFVSGIIYGIAHLWGLLREWRVIDLPAYAKGK